LLQINTFADEFSLSHKLKDTGLWGQK